MRNPATEKPMEAMTIFCLVSLLILNSPVAVTAQITATHIGIVVRECCHQICENNILFALASQIAVYYLSGAV